MSYFVVGFIVLVAESMVQCAQVDRRGGRITAAQLQPQTLECACSGVALAVSRVM